MAASIQSKTSISLLHSCIQFGDLSEVKKILATHHRDKHFYNSNFESAAATALKYQKDEIYELLIANGISLGPHEDMVEIIDGQPARKKRKIRDIHRIFLKNVSEKHLTTLISCSRISHDSSAGDRRELLDLITKAFEDLNESSLIKSILKVVSTVKHLTIAFDFNRESVEHMDPMKTKLVAGTTYTNDAYVYIGAKGLRNDENFSAEENAAKRCDVLGTLIHELTHFAINLVYQNHCKPYFADDDVRQEEFSEIVRQSQTREGSEEVIKSVFNCYTPDKWHAELIVRVPHLIAFYRSDEEKFFEVSDAFTELFDFFNEIILRDFEPEYPLLEAKHEIREVNELCGVLSQLQDPEISLSPDSLNLSLHYHAAIIHVSSNCVQVTMKAIYQQLKSENNFETAYIFVELKTLRNERIFNLISNAMKLNTNPKLVINCDNQEPSEIIRIVQRLKKQVVVVTSKNFESTSTTGDVYGISVEHKFKDFSTEYQNLLLHRQLIFQGHEIALGDFFSPQSIDGIKSFPLQSLVTNQKIKIGKENKFDEIDIFIERSFLVPEKPDKANPYAMKSEPVELTFEELLNIAETYRGILFSDDPGAGKSVELKMVATRVKEKNPSSWVVFMDLKESCKEFQRDKKVRIKFETRDEISQFLSQNILKLKNFDAEVFTNLFNEDRLVIMMDGFDEICPSYEEFTESLVKGIRETRNQLWISTRPHLLEILEKVATPKVFKLKPFSEENRKKFFTEFFQTKINNEQELEKTIGELETFTQSLETANFELLTIPLLLRMIAEIFDDNPKLDLRNANRFSIYDDFIKKMFKRCMKKGPEAEESLARQFGNLDVFEFHLKTAFHIIFEDEMVTPSVDELIKTRFNISSTPDVEDVTRIGLMYFDGSRFYFVHRSFAEFFIAKYFFETIFLKKFRSQDEIAGSLKVFKGCIIDEYGQSYKTFFNFINDALMAFEVGLEATSSNSQKTTLPWDFEDIHLHCLAVFKCFRIIELLSHNIQNNREVWGRNSEILSGGNVFLTTARFIESTEFFENLLALSYRLFGVDSTREKLLEKNFNGENILCLAGLNSKFKIFEYLVVKFEEFMNPEQLSELFLDESAEQNLLHRTDKFEKLCELLKKKLSYQNFKKILKSRNSSGTSFISKSEENIRSILIENLDLNELKTLLCTTSKNGRTPLMFQASLLKLDEFRHFWEFVKDKMNAKEQKELLMMSDNEGAKAFHYSLKTLEVFVYVKNIYQEMFGVAKLREIIMTKVNDESVLFYAMEDRNSNVAFAELWRCMQMLFKREVLEELLKQHNRYGKTVFENPNSKRKVELLTFSNK